MLAHICSKAYKQGYEEVDRDIELRSETEDLRTLETLQYLSRKLRIKRHRSKEVFPSK